MKEYQEQVEPTESNESPESIESPENITPADDNISSDSPQPDNLPLDETTITPKNSDPSPVDKEMEITDERAETIDENTQTKDDDSQTADDEPEITPEMVVEATLFAADEPVTAAKLVEILGVGGVREVKKYIENLNQKYERVQAAFRIEAISGGFQMLTQRQYDPWLRKLIKVRSETKLTPAALETLAIIAYKQPILRVDVENIRGVAAGEMIRQLTDKGLVKVTGRAEVVGRPMLYGTTKKFLEIFGLNNLKDLPKPEADKRQDGKK